MRAPEVQPSGDDLDESHRPSTVHRTPPHTRRLLAAALATLAVIAAGCSTAPAGVDAGPASTAGSEVTRPTTMIAAPDDDAAAEPPPPPPPPPAEPLQFQTQSFDVAELNQAVVEAHDAYLAHREMFDAAARTGFTDEGLVESLVATADAAVKDGIYALAEQLTAQGLVVNGGTEVVGIELAWLHIPGSAPEGLQVEFNSCVLIAGTVEDVDGNPREDLTEDGYSFITARMAQHDGRWILWSQIETEEECPAHLLG